MLHRIIHTVVMGTRQTLLVNKRAKYDHELLQQYEAGLCLMGYEVKSIRAKNFSIKEAFIQITDGEAWIKNMHIVPYKNSAQKEENSRDKKILLKKREIRKIDAKSKNPGLTIIPTDTYITAKGKIKMTICLAKGRTKIDKREKLKERQWQRERRVLHK